MRRGAYWFAGEGVRTRRLRVGASQARWGGASEITKAEDITRVRHEANLFSRSALATPLLGTRRPSGMF
jgi:hypothetical protein